jgi:hypothetical protein
MSEQARSRVVRVIDVRREYAWNAAAFAVAGAAICIAGFVVGEAPPPFVGVLVLAAAFSWAAQRRRRPRQADAPLAPESAVLEGPPWVWPVAWLVVALGIGAFSLAVGNSVVIFGAFWLLMAALYWAQAESAGELARRSDALVVRPRGAPRRWMLMGRQA